MVLLQSTVERVTALVAQLVGLGILAAVLAAAAAIVHRWYIREGIARALALLVGLSGVAVYLNTTTALGTVIAGSSAPTETQVALFNISAFIVGTGGALLGRTVGDRFGTDVLLGEGLADVEADVGRIVQSVGRVVVVELPTDIDDIVGYDPVTAETKEELAGKRFVFPRRLTVEELRERLITRLKADYGVGHVDVELADDGTIEYLALGSRAAGIGPTLPPATNAVVIRADPAFAASAGDLVQVWETDPMRRVLTAELRGVAEDTVTIAIDAADTQKVDPTREYRLVTLPVEDRPDREFASLLRAAEETFSSVTVEAGSPLHGMPVGALDVTVVALKPEGEQPRAIPDRTTVLAPGDVVFAIARPEHLRRLETAARPLDPSLVSSPVPQQRSRPTAGGTPADDAPDSDQTTDHSDDGLTTDHSSDGQPTAAQQPTGDDATAGETEMPPAEAASGVDTPGDDTESESTPLADDSDETDSEEPAAPDPDSTDEAEPASATADDGEDADDDGQSGGVGSSSFQQFKEEFESGDADWAEEDERPPSEDESATADATADTDSADAAFEGNGVDTLDVGDEDTDDLDGLEPDDATDDDSSDESLEGLSFGGDEAADDERDGGLDDVDDSLEETGVDDGDGLADVSFDDDDDGGLGDLNVDDEGGDDDLSSLSFDDEDTDEGFSLDEADDDGEASDEEDGTDEASDEEDGTDEASDEEDDDDDGGGGGGAASFQQLKEEFESGDADWEDDISDSPGGDMRLDE